MQRRETAQAGPLDQVEWAADHGTFVPADEREMLMAAFASVVSERGFSHATVEEVVSRAGSDRETFEQYFTDLPGCLAQTFDVLTQRCFSAMTQAFLSTPGTWADAAYASGQAFFALCAGAPTFVTALVLELPGGGEAALAQRTRTPALLAEIVRHSFAEAEPTIRPAGDGTVFAQMLFGGVWEILRTYAEDGRIDELPDALPGIAFAALTPLVGREEALRVIHSAVDHSGAN